MIEPAERADAALDLAPEEHVGGGGQIVAERQVLIDDLDALLARFDRLVEMHVLAAERISPWVGGKLPAMTLTSVDLPAPLSPMRPSTSPSSSVMSTSFSAWIAPKCLETERNSRIGAPALSSFLTQRSSFAVRALQR